MAKIDVTKTELVWPGKYDEDGVLRATPRESLPFQVIETINESRATRQSKQSGTQKPFIFEAYEGKEGDTFEDGWKNKLIWGDNLLVTGSLLEKFAGKIDLIYIDPPFATGADFSFSAQIGDSGEEVTKERSVIEEKAYRDTWGLGIASFISMIYERVALMRDLLAKGGSIYVHMGIQVNHYVRLILEEIFGKENLVSEIIWAYGSPSGGRAAGTKLVKIHEYILHFAKDYHHRIENKTYLPYSEKYIQDWFKYDDGDGRKYQKRMRGKKSDGTTNWEKQYLDESKGVPASTVWSDIKQIYADPRAYKPNQSKHSEILGYPTQKPEALLKRIIEASSNKGGLIADFFCGSGTTCAVAEKLGRRWIGCDLGRWAIHTTRKRLLEIKDCKPVEILNLGKYERQYWQGVTFNGSKSKSFSEQALYEYLAFILKLYKARPISGMRHLHGSKSKALVHIGAVDAPVTIDEVNEALDECEQIQQQELHVLGWEWEMGLAGPNNEVQKGSPMHGIARQRGIKLRFLQIPREVMEQQAAAKGDVQFFELAYLKVAAKKSRKKLTRQIKIEDFVIPNPELIPEDVRDKVRGWSDYIDYWAVDWDFRNDTFIQGWVTYRTRNERKLTLESDPHTYEKPGKYDVLVKVIDIFGNDTSQMLNIEVK